MATELRTPGPAPREALRFFRSKGLAVSFDHRDVWRQEHAAAFTVAKAMNVDVLESIRGAVDGAIADGTTFAQFKRDLTPTLQKLGWWGSQEVVDPLTGETQLAQLGSPRRLRTIYRANLRTARAAGQWERAQRTRTSHPYLLYRLGPSEQHREEHVAWDGLLLPVDHPFWQTHLPPNGWGCKCWIRQVSTREFNRLKASDRYLTQAPRIRRREWLNKRTGEVERVPLGIDPGWDTNPGQARLRALTPPPDGGLPTSFPPGTQAPALPRPRPFAAERILAGDLPEEQYVRTFLGTFGIDDLTESRVFVDQADMPLVINADLFRTRIGEWKVKKRDRHRYIEMLADTIKEPDEIWWIWEPLRTQPGRFTLRRRYIARWAIEGEETPGLAVFEWGKDSWKGVTLLHLDDPTDRARYLEGQRTGLLAYRRT